MSLDRLLPQMIPADRADRLVLRGRAEYLLGGDRGYIALHNAAYIRSGDCYVRIPNNNEPIPEVSSGTAKS